MLCSKYQIKDVILNVTQTYQLTILADTSSHNMVPMVNR